MQRYSYSDPGSEDLTGSVVQVRPKPWCVLNRDNRLTILKSSINIPPMAEYEPLSIPGIVKVKLDNWLYPGGLLPDLDVPGQYQIPDRILFELIQDVGCSRGGQRWRKHHEIQFFAGNDAKGVIGYSALSQDKTYPSAWMRYQGITYEVRGGRSAGSETFTLFEVENDTAREVPLSETEQRRRILFVLSEACDNTPAMP